MYSVSVDPNSRQSGRYALHVIIITEPIDVHRGTELGAKTNEKKVYTECERPERNAGYNQGAGLTETKVKVADPGWSDQPG